MSTDANSQKHSAQPSEEFLVLAETIADIKSRFERVESEFSTQAKPLEAAGIALNAAVAGLKALQAHVLDQSILTLSTRLESTKATIDEQLGVVVSELKAADEAQSAKTDAASSALRAELAQIGEQIGKLTTQFGAEISRVSLEAKANAEKFAAVSGRDGTDGKAINPTGSYAADKAYSRLDLVSYMGGSYVSNVDSNRDKPGPRSKSWTQIAARGTGGGITDVTGIPGIAATVVSFLQSPSSASLGAAVGDETGTGAIVFANGPTIASATLMSPTMTTPTLGVASATSISAGAILVGNATGGMGAAGVINAKAVKIDGVDVATSTDTYWNSAVTGISYGGGNLYATSATASIVLGAATEVATLAVDASGGLTVTPKAGQGVGVGTAPVGTVVLTAKGTTSNDSGFAFLARNSSDTNLLYIRNDGFVNLPTTGGFQTAGTLNASGTGTHTFGATNTVTMIGSNVRSTSPATNSNAIASATDGTNTWSWGLLGASVAADGAWRLFGNGNVPVSFAYADGAATFASSGSHTFGTGGNTVTLASGAVTATGAITSTSTSEAQFAGGVRVKNGLVSDAASSGFLDYVSGATRIVSYGTDNSTAGAYSVVLRSANSSVNTTALSISNTGNATFAGSVATQGGTGSTPASAGAAGTAGTILWDANYVYVCVATNQWKRAAISTW